MSLRAFSICSGQLGVETEGAERVTFGKLERMTKVTFTDMVAAEDKEKWARGIEASLKILVASARPRHLERSKSQGKVIRKCTKNIKLWIFFR